METFFFIVISVSVSLAILFVTLRKSQRGNSDCSCGNKGACSCCKSGDCDGKHWDT